LTVSALPRYQFRELSAADATALDRLRSVVLSQVQEHYGIPGLSRDSSDVRWLQRLIDDQVFARGQVKGFPALGVAFGDVLATEFGLRWVMITEVDQTRPALRFGATTLVAHALTMISARVANGEPVDLPRMLDWLRSMWPRCIAEAI
jgi:hypothetical protein